MISALILYFSQAMGIVLRLPPLFVMDLILKSRYSVTFDLTALCVYIFKHVSDIFRKNGILHETTEQSFTLWIFHAIFGSLHFLGFVIAAYSFFLPTKQLLSAYLSIASVAVIFWSYVMNVEYMKYCVNLIITGSSLQRELFAVNKGTIQIFFVNYFAQAFWAIIFCFSSTSLPNFPPKKLIAGISFILPTLISIMPLPEYILCNIPLSVAAVEVSFLVYYLFQHKKVVFKSFLSPFRYFVVLVENYGFLYFAIRLWKSVNVNEVFKAYWYLRTLKHVVVVLHDAAFSELRRTGFFTVSKEDIIVVAQEVLIQSCDTFLAVIGLSCILTSLIVNVVTNVQLLLSIPLKARQNISPLVAVLFITLAMQSGLTALEPKERILRLYRNIILILAAVAYNFQTDIESALLSLNSSAHASRSNHLKVVLGGVLLIVYSCVMLVFLQMKHTSSAWQLAVIAFSTEVIIKVLVSFSVYGLNIIDGRYNTIWENFDDYYFFLISIGHISNFIFNVFLFFNACYMLVYESLGLTRIILIITHLYYNILSPIKDGFDVCIKRHAIIKTVRSLHEATMEQLKKFDDVCSVCYQPLEKARVTSCNHFFHGTCLRKWLHEQNTCPFCHKRISSLPEHDHQE